MAIGAWIIVGPGAAALTPVEAVEPSEDAPVALRVHQAGEDELGFVAVVGGKREIVVLLARILAEGHLKRAQNACGGEPEGQKRNGCGAHYPPGAHTTMLASVAAYSFRSLTVAAP